MSKCIWAGVASGVLLTVLAASVQAAEATTDIVKGRAPVAAPVFTPATPMPGDTVTVSFFSDDDGDVESGSAIQWLRNGVDLPGATGAALLLDQSGIGGDSLSVVITPKTDPAVTDPAIGNQVSSLVRVGSSLIGNYLVPDDVYRTGSDAVAHCQSLGARLPTKNELKQLFIDATRSVVAGGSATINNDMCTLYGWPLSPGACSALGGTPDMYWTSDMANGYHVIVPMNSGGQAATYPGFEAYTVCMP